MKYWQPPTRTLFATTNAFRVERILHTFIQTRHAIAAAGSASCLILILYFDLSSVYRPPFLDNSIIFDVSVPQ